MTTLFEIEKEIWYADYYVQIIKKVTAKYKADWIKRRRGEVQTFFNSRDEAVAWKRRQLASRVETHRREMKLAETELRKFDKKFMETLNA